MADNRTQIIITAKDETRAAINSAVSGLANITAAAQRLPVIGTAIAGAFSGAAITSGIKSVIDGADQLQKASQKYGIAVEQLSALAYAGKLSDVSLEAIGTGLKKLSVNMLDTAAGTGDAKEAFKALGIEVKNTDGSLKSSDEVLNQIADRFAGMEDGAGKTALAVRLFGKAGADLIPMLNQGSRGLAEMKDEAAALGVIVGGDLARQSEQFNDNLTRLSESAGAFGIRLANTVLPSLNEFVSQLVAGIKAAGGFWEAIKLFGTINPFKNNQENLKSYNTELAQIERRLQYAIPAAERAGLEANADALKKRIDYLKEISRQQALATTAGMSGRLDAKDLGPVVKSAAPLLADKGGMEAAKKAAEEARKAMAEAAQAAYDNALAAAEADQQIEKLRDHYNDLVEPAAKTMRELQKFEELAPALGLTADQIERIRDAFREKIDVEQYGKPLRDISEEIRKQNDLANDLGLTFQSAFEDAIVEGKKFSDVLKGLAQDILRIVIRRTVTEPLGNALSEMLRNVMPSFGGGRAAGGPVHPGQYYVVGERGPEVLIPNTSGTVLPAGSSGGGGAQVTVNVINQTPAQVTTREHVTDGRREIMVLVQDAVSALMVGGAMDGVMRQTYGAGRVGALRG